MTEQPISRQGWRDDEWLVVRCQLGEREAFDALVAQWHGPLWRCARRMAGDDAQADDIAQDVWVRVARNIRAVRDGTRWRAWLFTIARRVWMDRLRAQYARPPEGDVDVADVPDASVDDSRADDLEAMHFELARLPAIDREAVTLFYLQELSLDEVAEVLAVPVGTVKSRLFRARRLLRRGLEKART